jgi:hypothetical protein
MSKSTYFRTNIHQNSPKILEVKFHKFNTLVFFQGDASIIHILACGGGDVIKWTFLLFLNSIIIIKKTTPIRISAKKHPNHT